VNGSVHAYDNIKTIRRFAIRQRRCVRRGDKGRVRGSVCTVTSERFVFNMGRAYWWGWGTPDV